MGKVQESRRAREPGSRGALAEASTSLLRSPACASSCVPLVSTASPRAFGEKEKRPFYNTAVRPCNYDQCFSVCLPSQAVRGQARAPCSTGSQQRAPPSPHLPCRVDSPTTLGRVTWTERTYDRRIALERQRFLAQCPLEMSENNFATAS